MDSPVLSVRDLRVRLPLPGSREPVEIVRGVSFEVPHNGFHALVGESGCGKSLSAMALTRLPPADAPGAVSGDVRFLGRPILDLPPREDRALRRRGGIAYVFQDPFSALDPVCTIGSRIAETGAAPADVTALLDAADLPRDILRKHPCELSGGMAQRASLVAALARKPALLVADEPTTALDVLSQARVMNTLRTLCEASGTAVLFITHDLALVSSCAQTLSVLYAGQVVESGAVSAVFSAPRHPYTQALLRAVPQADTASVRDLVSIPGRVPSPAEWAALPCAFAPRCPHRSCLVPKLLA